jgi:uncharacterized membrane protein
MNKPKNYRENNNAAAKTQKGVVVSHTTYEGQLPPPEMMERYNLLDSSFANRIITMAEKEQEQQHKIQRKTTNSFIASMVLGMFFAFASVIIVSYLVYSCIDRGYSTAASTIAVGVIASVAGIFIYKDRKQKQEQKK